MALSYTRHERVFLKNHPEFGERWLQDRIGEDPSVLGLGDVYVVERERRQERGGRLDLLLADADGSQRFEVELMLGPTDESHIIRTIEYWDIERRRYPGYDHTAVLVAEDITSRFLNVLALFSGSVPFVGVQLNALKVGEQIVLDFVRVVDQRDLRRDDETAAPALAVDRVYWEARSAAGPLLIVDKVLQLINQRTSSPQELNYKRGYVGLSDGRRSNNFIHFKPRKSHARVVFKTTEAEPWSEKLDQVGLSAEVNRRGSLCLNLSTDDVEANLDLLGELVEETVEQHGV